MNFELFAIFVILSFINVVLQTIKSLLTINGTKFVSAIANAIAYGLYTVVVIYTVCELPLWIKVVVTSITNFFGVYVSKWLVDKFSKDRLWKFEMAVSIDEEAETTKDIEEAEIPYNVINIGKWAVYNCYCETQNASEKCVAIAKNHKAKISAYESKI